MGKVLITALLAFYSASGMSQVYKWVDSDGRTNYSTTPPKNTKVDRVDMRPAIESSSPAVPANNSTPAFKVDEDFSARDNTIHDQLDKEIEAERKALEDAKAAYAEAESNPNVFQTTVNGKTVTRRNVAAYEEKMKAAQAEVDLHEANLTRLLEQKSIVKLPMPPVPKRR